MPERDCRACFRISRTIPGMSIRKAIIPAAGQGTRLGAITRTTPKELVPLVDRPAISWIVEEMKQSGIDDICVVTSSAKQPALAVHLAEYGVSFRIQHQPLGLGHAVLTARDFAGDEPFAVVLPDDLVLGDPILARLISHFELSGVSTIALTAVAPELTSRYGVVAATPGDGFHRIHTLTEKPEQGTAPSNLTVTGRYAFTPAIWGDLERLTPGRNGEIQLTDALVAHAAASELHGLTTLGERHDLGSPRSWLAANIAFGDAAYGVGWRALGSAGFALPTSGG